MPFSIDDMSKIISNDTLLLDQKIESDLYSGV